MKHAVVLPAEHVSPTRSSEQSALAVEPVVRRPLLMLIVAVACLFMLMYAGSLMVWSYGTQAVERSAMRDNVLRAAVIIQDDAVNLSRIVTGWARAEGAAAFIAGQYPGFAEAHLNPAVASSQNIDLMIATDMRGNVRMAARMNEEATRLVEMDVNEAAALAMALLRQPFLSAEDLRAGIASIEGEPAIVAASPVYDAATGAVPVGAIIAVRFMGSAELVRLSTLTQLRVTLSPITGVLAAEKAADQVVVVDEHTVRAIRPLQDLVGGGHIQLAVENARSSIAAGPGHVLYMLISALGFAGTIAVLLLQEHNLLKRLRWLSRSVRNLCASSHLEGRLGVKGDDEVAVVATYINVLLDRASEYKERS